MIYCWLNQWESPPPLGIEATSFDSSGSCTPDSSPNTAVDGRLASSQAESISWVARLREPWEEEGRDAVII